MRNSCNGCRVLRKGCTEDCTIRPCLQWIKSSEAQANATVFLAKFYGRAGLINLIGSGPEHLRPGSCAYSNFLGLLAIFRSLLYEACGRIVNPIHGSVGLMWTGSWHLCQNAVQAVLKGDPVSQIPIDAATSIPVPPLKGSDIRHVSKDLSGPSAVLHKVARTRTRFKKSVRKTKPEIRTGSSSMESGDQESEGSQVSQAEPDRVESGSHEGEVGLDLTLGLALSVLS